MEFEETFIGRPNTIRTYKGLFKKHIKPEITDPIKFNEIELIELIKQWQEKDLSPSTIRNLITLTNRYICWAGGEEINTKPLIRGIIRSKQEEEIKALNFKEATAITNTCKEEFPEFYPILLCGLHAGLRRGEVFGLTNEDIDFFKNRIFVRHSYNGPTKNGKIRAVPMSKELNKVLVDTLTKKKNEKVFKQMNPGPYLEACCTKANIPIITFHDLRHTFATLALESGISPKKVQGWLGHSTLTTTLNIYWSTQTDDVKMNFLPGE